MKRERSSSPQPIEITAAQLPLHCPLPEQAIWNAHPRVYLPIDKDGQAVCPYCGAHYVLKGDVAASGH